MRSWPRRAELLVEDADDLRRRACSSPRKRSVGIDGRQVDARDHAEADVRRAARLEEPGLEVQADVADALAVELELLVVVRVVRVAEVVRAAVAAHDRRTARDAPNSSSAGPAWMPNAPISVAVMHVVDRVRTCRCPVARRRVAEVQEPWPQSSDAEAERQLLVAEDLRGVDRDVAARVHRGAERIEGDVTGRLCRRDRAGAEDAERDKKTMHGQASGHVSTGLVQPGHVLVTPPGSRRSNKRQQRRSCYLPRAWSRVMFHCGRTSAGAGSAARAVSRGQYSLRVARRSSCCTRP